MTGGKRRSYTRPEASSRNLAQEQFVVAVAELAGQALRQRKLSREQLADSLGVPPAEIRRRLSGRADVTLRALAGIFHALGYRLDLSVTPVADPPVGGRQASDQVGTVAATLLGGPGEGQKVNAPIRALEGCGPRPASMVEVAIVDGQAHVLDTAPEAIRAKADVAPLLYVRNFTADPTAPVYRYGGRRTPNRVRRGRPSAGHRKDPHSNPEE